MDQKLGLICMSFDGDFVTEKRAEFESTESAWEHANDMGSRWYFYPFYFVVTESGLTIKDSPCGLEFLNGKRVKSVKKFFNTVSQFPDNAGVDSDGFMFSLQVNKHFVTGE